MTNEPYLPPEARAYQAFLRWFEDAKRVAEVFDQEGVQVPDTLKHVLTDAKKGTRPRPSRLRPPEQPPRPPQAEEDWIWIDAREAMVRTVVLAILGEGKTIPIKELIHRVKEVLPKVNTGSIYNIGTNLGGNLIEKVEQGWKLKSDVKAPVIYKGNIWAPTELLQKQDLAAFRRMAIRHLLALSSDGLQVMQVFRQLESADWLHTSLSKDLVKADLFVMQSEHRVKRFGSQKKWTLINREV